MTKTAVVILNYNGEKLLRQFLPTVIQNSPDAEVIVADNASTDQSLKILADDFPLVRVIQLDKNYGFCGGYNRALKQVDATYYVLLNSDIEVTPNWLSPMVSVLNSRPDVAAIQPKILSYHDRTKFEYAGAAGGFIDAFGYPFCRGRIFNHVEEDRGQYDDEREIFWASGACLLIRSDVYHRFNGLDEDFFAHMEEIDLCWKIHRTTQKILYYGRSKVYHVGAGTLGYDSPFKTYLNFRNGLALLLKNMTCGELIVKLPVRIGLDWIASLAFLFQGKPKNALSVWRAHVEFWKDLTKNIRKRKQIHQISPSYSRVSIHPGLVLFDYYFKKRQTFNSIIPDRTTLS